MSHDSDLGNLMGRFLQRAGARGLRTSVIQTRHLTDIGRNDADSEKKKKEEYNIIGGVRESLPLMYVHGQDYWDGGIK